MGAPDDADLERWIDAFRGPLIGLVASWGAPWAVADELAQDAFAEAWVGRARFAGDPADLDAAGAWLRGIAWNLWRARERRERVRAAAPLLGDGSTGGLEPGPAPGAGPDPRHAALRRAFAHLSAPHQSVLRMTYLEGSSPREVAALLGLSTKAVESRLGRARGALRELAERELRRERDPDPRTEGAKP
jgi:RNA polymerase sigma-70 factor (ECF subfamily)